jgi:hypothetical protein
MFECDVCGRETDQVSMVELVELRKPWWRRAQRRFGFLCAPCEFSFEGVVPLAD